MVGCVGQRCTCAVKFDLITVILRWHSDLAAVKVAVLIAVAPGEKCPTMCPGTFLFSLTGAASQTDCFTAESPCRDLIRL